MTSSRSYSLRRFSVFIGDTAPTVKPLGFHLLEYLRHLTCHDVAQPENAVFRRGQPGMSRYPLNPWLELLVLGFRACGTPAIGEERREMA